METHDQQKDPIAYTESKASRAKPVVALLPTKDWVWLMVIVAGAAAGNAAVVSKVASGTQEKIIELDVRWQDRMAGLSRDIRQDIKELRATIPLLSLVDQNAARVREMEQRISKLEALIEEQ